MLTVILTSGFLLTSCSDNDDTEKESYDNYEVEAQLKQMTLREKVGQMFYVRPEVLDTTIHYGHTGGIDATTADLANIKLQAVNTTMLAVNEKYPVGGIILYAHNIENEAQLAAFIPPNPCPQRLALTLYR